jgi:RNA polymerase sigma-70 factor, ECF subfamily
MGDQQSALNDRLEEFARLFSKHDRSIFLLILSLVPNWADAEEVQQETNVKLWQEFDKFQLGSDFGACVNAG